MEIYIIDLTLVFSDDVVIDYLVYFPVFFLTFGNKLLVLLLYIVSLKTS